MSEYPKIQQRDASTQCLTCTFFQKNVFVKTDFYSDILQFSKHNTVILWTFSVIQAEENLGLKKSKWTEASWVREESPGEAKVGKLKEVQLFSRIRLNTKHVTHSAYTVNTNGLQGTFSIHSGDTKATLLLSEPSGL